jgi:tetratricopeptide (TPR) repeat protein
MFGRRRALTVLLVCAAISSAVIARAEGEDAVYLKPSTPGGPVVRLRGEIAEYTGRELRIRNSTGGERTVPTATVARIEFTKSPEQASGDEQFAARDWQLALASYQRALDAKREPREWVRRQILAQMVWCYRNLGVWDEAGKYFLLLVTSDPATQYFDSIPLVWSEEPLRPEAARLAAGWLAAGDQPIAVLMGGSLLVDSQSRTEALTRLRALLSNTDPRIVWLAYAQLWRAGANNATDEQRRSLATRIESSDNSLRAGPYYILGQSLLPGHPVDAAIALMHVPVEFERERKLAADSLLATAGVLEQLKRPEEALGLYREAVARYPDAAAGKRAAHELERLGAKPLTRDIEPPAGDFLDGLRGRRLYGLAEKYCEDRLTGMELDDRQRTELVVELSRTLAEHALAEQPGSALPLWERAGEEARVYAEKFPQSSRLILVRLQGALVRLAEGEAARLDAHEDYPSPAMEDARRILRDAISQLEEVAKLVATGLRQVGTPRMANDELTTAELQSLELNVHLELARALRNQAECYAPASADRINSLTRASEALAVLSRHKTQNALYWRAALEQIAGLRLLGDFREAEQRVKSADAQRPPAIVEQQLRAERIRVALARGNVDDALAEAGTAADRVPSAELDFARLEAFVAAAKRDSDWHKDAEAAAWQRRAVDQAAQIRRAFGGAWTRRADSLLAASVAGGGGAQSYATLAFSAAGYYRGGELAKAIAAFDEAAEKARAEKLPEKATEAAYSAATIEKERGNYAEAKKRYEQLAVAAPDAPQAAAAHLMAAYCAGQIAQMEKPPQLDEYQRLLREHVQKWPTSETASQAYSWLGRLAEHERKWAEAIELLSKVKASDPQYGEAVEAIGRSYEAWLAQVRAAGKDTRPLADQSLAALEKASGAAAKRGAKPDAGTRAATTAAARIWLTEMPNGALPAERILTSAIQADSQAPATWKFEALRWLVPALALQGKGGQADAIVDELADSRQQLTLLDALATVRRSQKDPDARLKLAQLELDVQTQLLEQPGELDSDALRGVRRSYARTLAETGRRRQGLEALEQLAREFPRDGQTYEDLATLLAEGNQADQEAAIATWSDVARKSRPGTARWFRAHAGLAAVQLKLGKRAAARATIEHVRAKFPSLDGEFKARFDALAAEAAR